MRADLPLSCSSPVLACLLPLCWYLFQPTQLISGQHGDPEGAAQPGGPRHAVLIPDPTSLQGYSSLGQGLVAHLPWRLLV